MKVCTPNSTRRFPPRPNPQMTAEEMDVTYLLSEWEEAGQPRCDFAFIQKVRPVLAPEDVDEN